MEAGLLDENFLDFEWINVPEVKFSDISIQENTKVLIIARDTDLTENAKILLSKILQSIGIDLTNEAVLTLLGEHDFLRLSNLEHNKESLLCLVMGLDPAQLCLQIQYKQNEPFILGQNKCLFTYNLASLENSVDYKKALWAALKAL